ncbi:MAG TPA: SDR family oxidoreductase [Candidatus Kapabacteria bacterium]|nr:SDR family oxidoreductase [Candidatus Kapabacteria bacterium]
MSIALITGSGVRLGKALAISFAQKGWDIVLHYNQSKQKAEEAAEQVLSFGVNAYLYQADLLNSKEIEVLFQTLKSKEIIPDLLINNAGIFPGKTALENLDEMMWDEVLGVNLKAQYLCSKEFIKIQKGHGRIINIASVGAFGAWNGRLAYNVSKAGVIRLTKALAKELAPNVLVNCICPGSIDFPEERTEADKSIISTERIPARRLAKPEDICEAAYFFANCNDYITGQYLIVDGGYTLSIEN